MIFLKKLVLTSQVGKINLILCVLQIAVRKKRDRIHHIQTLKKTTMTK